MSDFSEAPQSVSTTIYYRGCSMIITKRDPEAKIKPLIISQMEMIDWALDEKECKPSWNTETNNQNTQTKVEDLGNCDKCKAPNKLSQKGKKYCSAKCWL